MEDQKTRGRGRPPKFDTDTAKDLLIDSAVETLLDRGLTPGLTAINLDEAIDESGVPRGTAYKLWGDTELGPLQNFRHAVLLRLFTMSPETGISGEIHETVSNVLESHVVELMSDDPVVRAGATRRGIRSLADTVDAAISNNDLFHLYRSISSAAVAMGGLPPYLHEAMRDAERNILNQYASIAGEAFKAIGVELDPCYTIEHLTLLLTALNQGLTYRPQSDYGSTPIMRPTAADGSMQEWTPFAVGVEALLRQFLPEGLL
ncbi:MAG: hypothetical protein EX269_10270 [Acidimicrobiales bacterium]|nr:MAG: hypothetical protein EX269_10270 [Acidimicrobiales bacterium]